MEKRDALKACGRFFSPFSRSRCCRFSGTLVRSGVLTSVHAFASYLHRGVFILAILASFFDIAARWRCSPGVRRN